MGELGDLWRVLLGLRDRRGSNGVQREQAMLVTTGCRLQGTTWRLTRERKEVWKSGLCRRKATFVSHADGSESGENPHKNPFIPYRFHKPNRTFGQCMAFLSRGESEILIPGY